MYPCDIIYTSQRASGQGSHEHVETTALITYVPLWHYLHKPEGKWTRKPWACWDHSPYYLCTPVTLSTQARGQVDKEAMSMLRPQPLLPMYPCDIIYTSQRASGQGSLEHVETTALITYVPLWHYLHKPEGKWTRKPWACWDHRPYYLRTLVTLSTQARGQVDKEALSMLRPQPLLPMYPCDIIYTSQRASGQGSLEHVETTALITYVPLWHYLHKPEGKWTRKPWACWDHSPYYLCTPVTLSTQARGQVDKEALSMLRPQPLLPMYPCDIIYTSQRASGQGSLEHVETTALITYVPLWHYLHKPEGKWTRKPWACWDHSPYYLCTLVTLSTQARGQVDKEALSMLRPQPLLPMYPCDIIYTSQRASGQGSLEHVETTGLITYVPLWHYLHKPEGKWTRKPWACWDHSPYYLCTLVTLSTQARGQVDKEALSMLRPQPLLPMYPCDIIYTSQRASGQGSLEHVETTALITYVPLWHYLHKPEGKWTRKPWACWDHSPYYLCTPVTLSTQARGQVDKEALSMLRPQPLLPMYPCDIIYTSQRASGQGSLEHVETTALITYVPLWHYLLFLVNLANWK